MVCVKKAHDIFQERLSSSANKSQVKICAKPENDSCVQRRLLSFPPAAWITTSTFSCHSLMSHTGSPRRQTFEQLSLPGNRNKREDMIAELVTSIRLWRWMSTFRLEACVPLSGDPIFAVEWRKREGKKVRGKVIRGTSVQSTHQIPVYNLRECFFVVCVV